MDRVAFAEAVATDVRAQMAKGIRPDSSTHVLFHFLADRRLVRREVGEDDLLVGRTKAVIAQFVGDLRDHLESYRQHLEDVRQYRSATRETRRSRRTEWVLFAYYLVPFGRFLADRGFSSWQQITPDVFREAVRGWRASESTKRLYLSSLKTFLDVLVEQRRIFRNPLASMRLPALPRLGSVRPQDVARAVAVVGDTTVHVKLRAVVALVALHGLTPAEVSQLRLDDLRRRNRDLSVRRRRRCLPLDPLTFGALVAYLGARPATPGNSYLFVTDRSAKSGRAAHFAGILRELGFAARRVRHAQIHASLLREDAVIVARLFGLSLKQVHAHTRLLGLTNLEQTRSPAARSQHRVGQMP